MTSGLCDAIGIPGPFSWWPELRDIALARGQCTGSWFSDLVHLIQRLALSSVRIFHFSGGLEVHGLDIQSCLLPARSDHCRAEIHSVHWRLSQTPSTIHAELLALSDKFPDGVCRWATGAAHAKRTKCGPRYTTDANRALQVLLRRCLRMACLLLFAFLARDGPEAMVPCFAVISSINAVLKSDLYWPSLELTMYLGPSDLPYRYIHLYNYFYAHSAPPCSPMHACTSTRAPSNHLDSV